MIDIEDLLATTSRWKETVTIKRGKQSMKIKKCPDLTAIRPIKPDDPPSDDALCQLSNDEVYFCDVCSTHVYAVRTEAQILAHKKIKNKPRCVLNKINN